MDDWDEAKLNEVVNKKHGEKNGLLPASSIVCKYFVEAVELGKYGWFWDCPNGNEKCQYRHALPPGTDGILTVVDGNNDNRWTKR